MCSSAGSWWCWSRQRIRGRPASSWCRCSSRSRGCASARRLNVAFSPERVDPGRTDYTLKNTPKVVGGITPACVERAAELYGRVCDHDRARLDPRGGRDDEAAREHLPLGQHRARQRAGDPGRPDGDRHLGGRRRRLDQALRVHALRARPRDGRPLPARRPVLPDAGAPASFTCRPSSSSSPARSTSRCPTTASSGSSGRSTSTAKPVKGSKIAILGVSYKGGVGDIRESPALRIIEVLAGRGARDRLPRPVRALVARAGFENVALEEAIADADAVVLVTAHPGIDHAALAREARLFVDLRGVTRGERTANVIRL